MAITVFLFSTTSISSVTVGEQVSECFYKNMTIFNFLMRMLFAMVDLILDSVTYFIMKGNTFCKYLTLIHMYITTKNIKILLQIN